MIVIVSLPMSVLVRTLRADDVYLVLEVANPLLCQ